MERILIINDEVTKVENLRTALSNLSFEISSTQDIQGGLQFFHESKPFLIILDLQSNSELGPGFIEQLIRQEGSQQEFLCHYITPPTNPELHSLSLRSENFYVIVLTENLSKSLMHKYRDLGVDYLLSKPVHLYTLQGIINTIYRLKTTRDELCEKFAPIYKGNP